MHASIEELRTVPTASIDATGAVPRRGVLC
jgi:hypothetical protein